MKAILRALPTLLRVGLAEMVAYRAEFLVWALTTNMPLIMLAVWSAVAREAPVAGWGTTAFTAYYLCTMVVRLLTNNWVFWELNMDIRNGTLVTKLLRPMNPLVTYAAAQFAALPMRALVVSPLLVAAWLWAAEGLTPDVLRWGTWPVVLLGAWVLQFNAMILLGLGALYLESAAGLFEIWMAVNGVLGGYLVPVALFPDWLSQVANALPFSLMLSLPVEWVTRAHDGAALTGRLFQQWTWVAATTAAVVMLWRVSLKRFAAFGG